MRELVSETLGLILNVTTINVYLGRFAALVAVSLIVLGAIAQAQDYQIIKEKDSSFGNIRYRITLEIEAPEAQTDNERLQSMMTAAVDRHRQDWPDAVSVRLWDSYEDDFAARNRIVYTPDGCGWTGDDCTDELWTDPLHGTIPEDLANWGRPTDKEEKAGQDLKCRQDLRCWANEHSLHAILACQPLIEDRAKYDFKWTDGFFGSKLERWRWDDREEGSLAYTGDEVKFMNAFGAWQRIAYWCFYNPNTEEVRIQLSE